jgi:hypothetical protein
VAGAPTWAEAFQVLFPEVETDVADLCGAYDEEEEFGCTWGSHDDLAVEQPAERRAAVHGSKGAFAFSLWDMSGYHGELGPVQLKVAHDDPVWSCKVWRQLCP